MRLIGVVDPDAELLDTVAPDRRQALPRSRAKESYVTDVVMTKHDADRVARAVILPIPQREFPAYDRALVELLELIAVQRILQQISEIREKIQVIVDCISIGPFSSPGEDAIPTARRIRSLRRGQEDRLSDLALAGLALGAYAAIVMPSTYLAHHVVESVLGWLG
jgi:hypothetical protein